MKKVDEDVLVISQLKEKYLVWVRFPQWSLEGEGRGEDSQIGPRHSMIDWFVEW